MRRGLRSQILCGVTRNSTAVAVAHIALGHWQGGRGRHLCRRTCLTTPGLSSQLYPSRTIKLTPRSYCRGERADRPLFCGNAEQELRCLEAEVDLLYRDGSSMVRKNLGDGLCSDGAIQAETLDSGGQERAGGTSTPEWPEPTLEDLDRSIPQVDCDFMADLIRVRRKRRQQFLDEKVLVKAKAAELSKSTSRGVAEIATFRTVGGWGLWSRGGGDVQESALVTTSAQDSVVASPEALEKLNADELDTLYCTRPEYDDGFILLDCRTVNEVTSWGILEGAKVLPAHDFFEAFQMTPSDFLSNFGFPKPHPSQRIICYCQYGPRSLMAAQLLSWMGYPNVLHFRPGYYEWGKQFNLLLRRWMEHDQETGRDVQRQAVFQAGLELQREIAVEFNAQPMEEASRYHIDVTRSRGKLLVGETLREDAYAALSQLTGAMPPPAIAGVLDAPDGQATAATAASLPVGDPHLMQFLEQATGLNPQQAQPEFRLALGDAQEAVVAALSEENADRLPGR